MFFGLPFIVWSWASTIIIVGWFLEPLLAFLVTVAEFVSAGRWLLAYTIVLLLGDASALKFGQMLRTESAKHSLSCCKRQMKQDATK